MSPLPCSRTPPSALWGPPRRSAGSCTATSTSTSTARLPPLQGYLAHQKPPPLRNEQWDRTSGPVGVLGGWAISSHCSLLQPPDRHRGSHRGGVPEAVRQRPRLQVPPPPIHHPPMSSEPGAYKTVAATFWPWLSGKSFCNMLSCSLLARQRQPVFWQPC